MESTNNGNIENIPIKEIPSIHFNGISLDDNGHLKRKTGIINDCYVCLRPGNKLGVPKVYTEEASNQRIIGHAYGHAGIGWSLLWGSADKVIDLVQEKTSLEGKKIAVIGTGCIGSGVVMELVRRGVNPANIEIFTEKMDNTITSYRSGAILSTASVLGEVDPNLQRLYDEININSFIRWKEINEGKAFPELKEGVHLIDAYFGAEKEWGTVETPSGLDIFVEKGLMDAPNLVYLKFKEKLNLFRCYKSYYFNPHQLMKFFYNYFSEQNIKVNMGRINSFNEIPEEFGIVFNCSGVGNSVSLTNDEHIFPTAGHMVVIKDQDYNETSKYYLYSHYISKEEIGKVSFHESHLFYYMPKSDLENFNGILGGSFVYNYWGDDENLNEKQFKTIVKKAMEVFGEDPNTLI